MTKNLSIDDFQDLWHLVTQKHSGQKYGGTVQDEQIEYINHIGSVVFEIITASQVEAMDTALAIRCALLHDTLEDTNLTYAEIKEKYGNAVADGVLALTKDQKIEGKHDKMIDSLRRIKIQPLEIWAVKMADRITNLYAPPYYWSNDKKKEYIEEAKLILSELREGSPYLADRLATKIDDYYRFLDCQG
ncbi:HD domain-containing protein [Pseudochryseolinea flava]|uniref:Bifunctional (P)ppGpp synthetase/guanosine-3',5'-bis(Diphosphate) 3'-pyrophosphohydrolase n=1 Tax=Pseudochryseolinea flava TaxID=2059302 RepID=A0A364Y072_9BACT|nr:HD domain-containing protein [Pseudochryseolinea flava]RAW00182.1 bifunctional (p)ppGpp synthetase/guanosine-3',5'-bis(diphosphate) 3'-pyrophosphohydrolase [Pseudochryseolinea flava]